MTVNRSNKILQAEHFGALPNGNDVTAQLQNALMAAEPDGYTVMAERGLRLAGRVQVPSGVGLVGYGKHLDPTFILVSAAAGIDFGEGQGTQAADTRHPRSGDFYVEGNKAALNPLRFGVAVQSQFESIRSGGAAVGGSAVSLEGAQNSSFDGFDLVNSDGNLLSLDFGANGNTFNNCHLSGAGAGAYHLRILGNIGAIGGDSPDRNMFFGGRLERSQDGPAGVVYAEAGIDNTFFGTAINSASNPNPHSLITIAPHPTNPALSPKSLRFSHATLRGSGVAATTGITQTGGDAPILDNCRFQTLDPIINSNRDAIITSPKFTGGEPTVIHTGGRAKIVSRDHDRVGTTAERPAAPYVGERMFDTSLGFPVWWDAANWVNAAGVIS